MTGTGPSPPMPFFFARATPTHLAVELKSMEAQVAQLDRYRRRCASAAAPCGDFNATLHAYARRAKFRADGGRVLIVHNENRAGFGNQIRPRLVALWLGLALDRRVYVKSCQRDGTTKRWRMPRCGTPHFQADDFLEVLGVGALGVCDDTPLARMFAGARTLRLADGPDEVHLETIAKLEVRRSRM